jgi:hypothetical protein
MIKIVAILILFTSLLYGVFNLAVSIHNNGEPNLGRPVAWDCSVKSPTPYNSTKIFIGVFTTKESIERRDLIRKTYLQHVPDNIMYKFIIGKETSKELQKEMDEYHDILPLNIKENMNEGKTLEFFKTISETFENQELDFILKADDDAYLQLERIANDLAHTSRRMSYWGFLVGETFMGGECYGLSYDLARWVATAPIPRMYKSGHEDSQVQKWFKWARINKNVKYQVRNCHIHDHIDSGTVYSKHIDVNETMVVHYLKQDYMFKDAHRRLYPTYDSFYY